jgi:hypothetical protein
MSLLLWHLLPGAADALPQQQGPLDPSEVTSEVATELTLEKNEEPMGPPQELAPPLDPLEPIRSLVVELKFEQALAQLELLLDDAAALRPETTFRALELRSQTFAALGEFDRALTDYRQLLMLNPRWRPDRTATPKKAMGRFDDLRDELIGTVELVLTPADAFVVLDGDALEASTAPLELLAGEHLIRVESAGHDSFEERLEVLPGKSQTIEVDLIPNARTVIFRTEPAGVELWVDGTLQGMTERDESFVGIGDAPAEILIANIPLGEHRFELRKDCYRTESIVEDLHVDLLDRQPQRYDTFRMIESYVPIMPQGDLVGAQISIDGAPPETLPTDALLACPGPREVVVRLADRTLWKERIEVREGPAIILEIAPRPNLAWVGTEAPQRELDRFTKWTNRYDLAQPPSADPSSLKWWQSLSLPSEIDLAIAPAGSSRQGLQGLDGGWWLYSPLLSRLVRVENLPDERPSWSRPEWGWRLIAAPSGEQARAVVLSVTAGGVAEQAGLTPSSRLLSVGGSLERLEPIDVEWLTPEGERKTATLQPQRSPHWIDPQPTSTGAEPTWRAAWAVVDAATGTVDAPHALANLALLVDAYGDSRLAAKSWRRVQLSRGEGLGAGTVQYYLGRTLQRLGDEAGAIVAFRRAASLGGSAHHDAGPPVAPAARDRLTDLGEAP